MKPILSTVVIAFIGPFAASITFHADAVAQDGTDPGGIGSQQADTPPRRPSDATLNAEADEIEMIRERLGIDLYRGTCLEQSADDPQRSSRFLEVYRRIAMRPRQIASMIIPPGLDAAPLPFPASRNDLELFDALLEAGRQLDLAAAQRESSRQFDEAARLRRLAQKIRKFLPQFSGGNSPGETQRPGNN